MSLSLSSLLNPSPDSESAPPPRRNESLPSIQYVQSPESQYTTSPVSAHPSHHYSYPPATEHDAVQALAALSGAPPPIASQWYPHSAPLPSYDGRSNSFEQRPGSSGYNEPVQLPPPTPSSSGRKPSSPTLDQYHVASRSPEQRKPGMISPAQAGFTLPPIQSLNQQHSEPIVQPLAAYQPPPALVSAKSDPHAVNGVASVKQTRSDEQARSPQNSAFRRSPPSSELHINTNTLSAKKQSSSPPATIKQEAVATPRDSSPTDMRRAEQPVDADSHNMKAIASLKNEHGLRTHSPLRESSVPVPSTEMPASEPSNPKKRPAPAKTKKGTATTTSKKAPPAKKRKVEPKRSVTPSSRASKPLNFQTGSSKATPANSSPAPSTRSQSEDAYDEPYDDDDDMDDGDVDPDGDVYCVCRKPDNGTFMIGCDGTCDDWFHGKCVGIEERDKNGRRLVRCKRLHDWFRVLLIEALNGGQSEASLSRRYHSWLSLLRRSRCHMVLIERR